jgi:hypothetical protein
MVGVGVFSILATGVVVVVPDQALYFSSRARILSSIDLLDGDLDGDISGSDTSSNVSLLGLELETLIILISLKLLESGLSVVETKHCIPSLRIRSDFSRNFFGTTLFGDRFPNGLMIVVLLGEACDGCTTGMLDTLLLDPALIVIANSGNGNESGPLIAAGHVKDLPISGGFLFIVIAATLSLDEDTSLEQWSSSLGVVL